MNAKLAVADGSSSDAGRWAIDTAGLTSGAEATRCSAGKIILAVGAHPAIPGSIQGLDTVGCV